MIVAGTTTPRRQSRPEKVSSCQAFAIKRGGGALHRKLPDYDAKKLDQSGTPDTLKTGAKWCHSAYTNSPLTGKSQPQALSPPASMTAPIRCLRRSIHL
jgi:hypothetical protein